VGLYKRSGLVVPDVWVEELAPHKALRLPRTELGVINCVLPVALDPRDHVVDDLLGLLRREFELHGNLAAEPELAVAFPGPSEGNGVSGGLPRAGLRSEIEGRGQVQVLAVPECGVVAQVVIGVSDADVEHGPGEEFPQRCRNVRPRTFSNGVGELGVGGVSNFQFVYAQDCESGEHLLALAPGPRSKRSRISTCLPATVRISERATLIPTRSARKVAAASAWTNQKGVTKA
jgi:hypothetical protein